MPNIDSEIILSSSLKNQILSHFASKLTNEISKRFSNDDCGVDNQPFLALKVSKEAY